MSVTEAIARLALSVSSQAVVILALAAGLALILARSDAMLVLALLASYLAVSVLLAGVSTPELAVVAILVGIFVALVMQLTAADRRADSGRLHGPATMSIRLLMSILMLWIALSIGLFRQPPDAWVFTEAWLVASAGTGLLMTTDPFRVGIALLMLTAAAMLFYATGTGEVSLMVEGLIAGCAFAVALSTSHLALERDLGEGD